MDNQKTQPNIGPFIAIFGLLVFAVVAVCYIQKCVPQAGEKKPRPLTIKERVTLLEHRVNTITSNTLPRAFNSIHELDKALSITIRKQRQLMTYVTDVRATQSLAQIVVFLANRVNRLEKSVETTGIVQVRPPNPKEEK